MIFLLGGEHTVTEALDASYVKPSATVLYLRHIYERVVYLGGHFSFCFNVLQLVSSPTIGAGVDFIFCFVFDSVWIKFDGLV